ncbi:MAG TPA: HAMP domain-containing sensor histidine kinase [Candidatus Limnocylindrales bacterium]|nr:HAMP domain-containing sensor histidine kinase [Candidatus Limnocylindrales bacterium]
MYLAPGQEAIPFHLIWLGLCLVYGFTTWRPVEMVVMVVTAAAVTGAIMFVHAARGLIGWSQTAEVPMSVALAAVIAVYLRRRHLALMELSRIAAEDRHRTDARQVMARRVSHELRTPITIARGFTELVRERVDGDPQAVQDTAVVLKELDKLAAITDRLLTVFQLDGEFHRQPLALDEELARIVRRWIPAADRQWTVACDPAAVPANRDRLEVVLDCLLDNAVRFTSVGDRIAVRGRVDRHEWSIEVADSGLGMSGRDAMALTAAQPIDKNPLSGTGEGLAVVRAVVGGWGGGVSFHAEPGKGTTVLLRFPRTPGDDSPFIAVGATT